LTTKADLFVAELRKWVNQYQAEPFLGQSLPPILSSEILLDRYHSHTKNCASCRGALVNIQRLKWGSMILIAIALILTPILFFIMGQNPLVGISLSSILLISLVLWFSLNKLEKKFYQGNPIPLRNFPDKK
jgi:hypothetical protein